MNISVKRAYDRVERKDGFRVLIDRLWPRGVSKSSAKIDLWAKEVAPSSALRSWFHGDTEKRFTEFSKKYERELERGSALAELKKMLKGKKAITLVTAVKDIEHSHIPILLKKMKG